MLNRRFAIPAICSLGLHSALFLGIGKPTIIIPGGSTILPMPPTAKPVIPDVEPIPPPVENTESTNMEPMPRIGEPRPTQEELIREPGPQAFVTPTEIETANPIKGISRIGEVGVVGGIINGSITNKMPSRIVDSRHLDRPPLAKFQPSPSYPTEARRTGLTGEVLVDFIVGPKGEVLDANVVNSTSVVFEEPARRAVLKWLFEPGKKDGKIVKFRMRQQISFNITND